MWLLEMRLENAGFSVQSVGYDSFNTSIDEMVENVSEQINSYLGSHSGTIHFVGHSMGGLLVRAYLDERQLPNLGRTVLIGTPNQGTPLADRYRDNFLVELLGISDLELGTGPGSFPHSLDDPYYPVGVIAGQHDSFIADSLLDADNDGMVPVTSTRVNNMTDFILLDVGHSAMRYDKGVADQTVHFLINGQFKKTQRLTPSPSDKT